MSSAVALSVLSEADNLSSQVCSIGPAPLGPVGAAPLDPAPVVPVPVVPAPVVPAAP